MKYRMGHDRMERVSTPADKHWGTQEQRSVEIVAQKLSGAGNGEVY